MRLFPIRMTTRRWMVGIAIVGLVLGGSIGGYRLKRRRDGLLQQARFNEDCVRMHVGLLSVQMGTPLEPLLREAIAYEAAMVRKYERAACFPWLAVERDPPRPYYAYTIGKVAERPRDSSGKRATQGKVGASGEP
jgi:hypothetical protein